MAGMVSHRHERGVWVLRSAGGRRFERPAGSCGCGRGNDGRGRSRRVAGAHRRDRASTTTRGLASHNECDAQRRPRASPQRINAFAQCVGFGLRRSADSDAIQIARRSAHL
ncbi:hypothetical protein [Lysobacter enzymogenes]|uniref:hypothetical protein n=1 Tax=Lysobacter enzymogenes TaxID=69 RepID=UPI0019D2EE1F|nr:hypothetical protein [Lysobacter enzymogenes]